MALTDRFSRRTLAPFLGGVATTLFGVLFVYAMTSEPSPTRTITIEIHNDDDSAALSKPKTFEWHFDSPSKRRLFRQWNPDASRWTPPSFERFYLDPDHDRLKWQLLPERDFKATPPRHDYAPLHEEMKRLRERVQRFEAPSVKHPAVGLGEGPVL